MNSLKIINDSNVSIISRILSQIQEKIKVLGLQRLSLDYFHSLLTCLTASSLVSLHSTVPDDIRDTFSKENLIPATALFKAFNRPLP